LSSVLVAILLAGAILAGAAIGTALRRAAPAGCLDAGARDTVKSGVSLLGTLASLVLGMVLASAKGSYDTLALEVRDTGARLVQLDQALRRIGPAAAPARERLAAVVADRVHAIWGGDAGSGGQRALNQGGNTIVEFQASLQELKVGDGPMAEAVQRALQLTDELQQLRSLAIAHPESTVLTPLLAVIALWFAAIAVGWNVLAQPNVTVWIVNIVAALSVASAMLIIIEMDRPFSGLMKISDAPLRAAIAAIQR
jgi:hypothetical protein